LPDTEQNEKWPTRRGTTVSAARSSLKPSRTCGRTIVVGSASLRFDELAFGGQPRR
jgi:hypothetical protein